MKTVLPLLLLTCASVQAQPHSPELTQLLSEIHEQYDTATLAMPKRAMADITKLPYFLMHIDEKDTVESKILKTHLRALQEAYFGNATRQQELGGNNWFCMRDLMALDPNRHPEFLEDMIWTVLEKTAKNNPERFTRYNYSSSFAMSTSVIFEYGLQTEYPCYSPIPKALQFQGWKY
ncbi:hypothetical protein CWO17_17585 [Vibrio sp. 10N.286.45.A3]|uniref:Uncharacterized protein n=2 Tax=Vibrio TaxID=662 RepID=A0A2N7CF11_VIBSP|nr:MULTISPECIES: hypothetical protein [Vibrio]PMF21687.1 hypothetical protein BCV19_00915 [Vibrio splendidus]PTP00224.1 hypothetical protein CWO17_17585 [Vibrio sp. 10N.286.45.A3]TKE81599.1 hypothetical protein FCV56_13810 [Vibrio sp. F12]TKE83310.1 hypothetical protein FCV54_10665 [Vibrio sp. F12]TKE89836.1 hypothetical protein FCV53_17735 [Vibrio sp. F12]